MKMRDEFMGEQSAGAGSLQEFAARRRERIDQ
jgi:hypothetical protein